MKRLAALATALACLAPLAGGCGGGATSREFAGGSPDDVPSAFARPSAALARAGAPRSFMVRPDGSLDNGAWCVELTAGANGVAPAPPRRIAYEERWCPVVRWRRAGGGVTWDFEAVAFPAPGDTALVASLAVRATNAGAAPAQVRLAAAVRARPAGTGWAALDAPHDGTPLPGWRDLGAGVAGFALDAPAGTPPRWSAELPAGGSRTWHLLLATYALPRGVLVAAARTPHARRCEDVRREWREALAGGMRIELGDRALEDAWRAALVVLLENRVRRGGHWLPRGNPFQYDDVWLRDGARAVAALAVAGHTREARELADGLAAFQWRSGAFLSQRGQLDGHGQALWAFAQVELRPAPDSSVARFAALAAGGVAWLRDQRAHALAAALPTGALLPFADPRDGELVRAQLVGNDAWAIAGLESAARLLRAAGREADARGADSLRVAWRDAFAHALARTGSRDVPPSWQGAGRDWGNLAVAWPCRALAPSDPRCAALAARVWALSGAGLASYGARDSLHGYVGADLGNWALLADRPADVRRALDALLQWRDATGAGAEVFSARTHDFGANWPPHPTSAGALVQLVRNSLIADDGDTLVLTSWLGDSALAHGVRVHRAPTRWGTLELAFARRGSQASWQWTAVPVWTALRLPPGCVLAAAPAAPLRGAPGGREVIAPPGTSRAVVTLAAPGDARAAASGRRP